MDLNHICKEVCLISKEAGSYIRDEQQKLKSDDIQVKASNSFVTYVDKTAEEILVKRLKDLIPEATFITEEGTIENASSDLTWIVDPLDGTTNFIQGIPCFSVSIALQIGSEMQAGVVYEVNSDECFSAIKNNGAFLNDKPISVSDNNDFSNTLIATGFPYQDFSRLEGYQEFLAFLMKNTRGIRRLGSAAVDLAYVACGRFDAFFEYGLNPWDVAAGGLIVSEAGGQTTEFGGGSNYVFGQEILASNNNIHSEFSQKLTEMLS